MHEIGNVDGGTKKTTVNPHQGILWIHLSGLTYIPFGIAIIYLKSFDKLTFSEVPFSDARLPALDIGGTFLWRKVKKGTPFSFPYLYEQKDHWIFEKYDE